MAKLHRGKRVPAAAMSRIRRTLPQGWSLQIKGNACHVTRHVPVHLYSLIGQDKAPVLGRTTFAHRIRYTLWFRPKLSLARHRKLAQEMARRHKRLRGRQHQVALSGMGGLCFRNDAPPARLKAFKRLADSMELVPTLYDETHSVHLLASTDGRSWEFFDRAVQQEVTMVRNRLNALFQRYPKVANAPTR